MRPVELARKACNQLGIDHFSTPTRGGTDGSRLTELGVPTPNLFTGMQNIHGPLEWVSVQDMRRATEMCIRLAELWGSEYQVTHGGDHTGERELPTDEGSALDWVG